MEFKLCSGVRVSVEENGAFKLLFFDRPVKAMELSPEESSQLGKFLLQGKSLSGITSELRNLVRADFFVNPRNFATIKKELAEKGVEVTPTSLNRILAKLVERKELSKEGQKGAYVYVKKAIEENSEESANA